MSESLSHQPPTDGVVVEAAVDAVFNWNYDSEVDQLRTLYVNAVDAQWSGLKALDWEREIDRDAFTKNFTIGGMPIHLTGFWAGLSADTQWELARRGTAFMLSNFLHGEQGALLAAAELVNAVPHMDGKFYAATQTMDEARHVEVFAAYIKKLDHVYPIAPGLMKLLDNIVRADKWTHKAVGMNIVVEGLALYVFRDMRNATQEPLLKDLLTYVSRDEARHTAFGIKYLSRVSGQLSDEEKKDIEDFAFESARLLIDSRAGTSMRESIINVWNEVGIDPATAMMEIAKDRPKIREYMQDQRGGRAGPLSGFVLPTLRSIGLFSERIRGHFEDMFVHNNGPQAKGMTDRMSELPEDLEAWVMAESG